MDLIIEVGKAGGLCMTANEVVIGELTPAAELADLLDVKRGRVIEAALGIGALPTTIAR